jgi:uncharacterized protein (UPF0332 family)
LLRAGRLEEHRTSREELLNLFRIVERDIADASIEELSADRRFATAYNAVLQSATAILHSKGYRPVGAGHHSTTFTALRIIMGKQHHELVDYFDSCRTKRNITDYDYAGGISDTEANELLEEAKKFSKIAREYIKT